MTMSVSLSPDALFQEVNGELVILDLASEKYFGLDALGTRIWQLLNENQSLGEVKEIILSEYDVSQKQLDADINQLLDSLQQAGLVKLEPAGG